MGLEAQDAEVPSLIPLAICFVTGKTILNPAFAKVQHVDGKEHKTKF